ncbi:hypothetical protein PRIPAC_82679 [Pristionchus pacificus]|uniref:Uncharacterized protein n=1 Tax=Pristionchus pacificus TaxID=54126 RepID=A0A2A6BX50_PRIPA|nr:hypothetical protein PRIPAC_82679 [Pristionchus pacificus]|eukprot:PDM70426.1 hypothetical protein PRIPAC_46672 [Pristionchus pacificus]
MWSLPLLALLLFTVVAHTTAHPSSIVSNRTLPYPHPVRSPRLAPALMQELMGPDGGKRALKAWNDLYLTEPDRSIPTTTGWPRLRPLIEVAQWSRANGQYWYIEQINDNEVALKSLTGKYVTHWNLSASSLKFEEAHPSDEAKEWEMLTPVKNEDGSWSFKSRWDHYLSAHHESKRVNFQPHNDRCEHWRLEAWY